MDIIKFDEDEDVTILKRIIETATQFDEKARARDLEKALAKVIKSNKDEREILIQILAYCGILQPKGRAGFFDSFVKSCRKTVAHRKQD